MLPFRFAAAFWLIYSTAVFGAAPTPDLIGLLQTLPELGLAILTFDKLPAVVAIACVVRWLRARPRERLGPFASATRWAILLSVIARLLLPMHTVGAVAPFGALGLAATQVVALLLLLDGPLAPET
jgi:hypothetical protein